jgi:hypothetical protein
MKSFEKGSAPEKKTEQREIPHDLKEIYVLFHGEPYDAELSYDARLRALAALEIAHTHPDSRISFVGGVLMVREEIQDQKNCTSMYANVRH